MGLIGTKFCPKEAAAIYEVAGDALALKHSIQVNTERTNKHMNTGRTLERVITKYYYCKLCKTSVFLRFLFPNS